MTKLSGININSKFWNSVDSEVAISIYIVTINSYILCMQNSKGMYIARRIYICIYAYEGIGIRFRSLHRNNLIYMKI